MEVMVQNMHKIKNTRARLIDIANEVGVSVNTVSLALRGSERVHKDTKAHIKTVARRLNYRPNELAKSLVSRSSKTIGLVLTDINNPHLTQVAKYAENYLSGHGYMTLLAASNNNLEEEIKIIEALQARMVDGILIFPAKHDVTKHLEDFANELPIISMVAHSTVANQNQNLNNVGVDEEKGAFLATQHLISMGHQSIAFIDSSSKIGNMAKQKGYIYALEKSGLTLNKNLIIYPKRHAFKSGYEAAKELFNRKGQNPTAIFCANDSLALGVLKYGLDYHISIPKDLSVMGFDNVPYGEYAHVPLTTIDLNAKEVAEAAVSKLINRIHNNNQWDNKHITVEPKLILRASTSRAQ